MQCLKLEIKRDAWFVKCCKILANSWGVTSEVHKTGEADRQELLESTQAQSPYSKISKTRQETKSTKAQSKDDIKQTGAFDKASVPRN